MAWPAQRLVSDVLFAGTTAATTARTARLDTSNASHATITVTVSAEANTDSTNVVASILESDDTVVTNFATFAAAHERTIDNTAAAIGKFHVPLMGRKRYLRLVCTPDTTTNGAVIISATSDLHKDTQVAQAATVSVG